MDSTATFTIKSTDYDYAIRVNLDTFFINQLEEKDATFKTCFGAMPKMGYCELLDTYQIKGKNMSKEGRTITILK